MPTALKSDKTDKTDTHTGLSEGDFVPTQMKRFLKCLVQSLECLCIWANSHIPFRITLLWSLIKVKDRVECPPLWSRTKRTKRTLTGLGFNRVNTNLKSSDSQRALCRPWNADVYGPLRITHFAFHCLESGSCGMPTALRSDKTDKPGKPDNHS